MFFENKFVPLQESSENYGGPLDENDNRLSPEGKMQVLLTNLQHDLNEILKENGTHAEIQAKVQNCINMCRLKISKLPKIDDLNQKKERMTAYFKRKPEEYNRDANYKSVFAIIMRLEENIQSIQEGLQSNPLRANSLNV